MPAYSRYTGVQKVLLVTVLGGLIAACSGKEPAQHSDETMTSAVHEAAVVEVQTEPATEIDTVHISPELLETYRQTCGSCHERGVVGAPKTGDAVAWGPRMAQGMDTLVAHVRDGFKAMPPTGLCYSCSDEDFQSLILHMATAQPSQE
ncbi:c-type cytochrome [Microbulbifer aggregans]|uniref:c-type cytochrome n=1 Tax=Microbulbifer aggregans TaxID=1769779 RepID=UPI001CFEDA73|nr:c-type cytochrome [Microbulbifer aggregans]